MPSSSKTTAMKWRIGILPWRMVQGRCGPPLARKPYPVRAARGGVLARALRARTSLPDGLHCLRHLSGWTGRVLSLAADRVHGRELSALPRFRSVRELPGWGTPDLDAALRFLVGRTRAPRARASIRTAPRTLPDVGAAAARGNRRAGPACARAPSLGKARGGGCRAAARAAACPLRVFAARRARPSCWPSRWPRRSCSRRVSRCFAGSAPGRGRSPCAGSCSAPPRHSRCCFGPVACSPSQRSTWRCSAARQRAHDARRRWRSRAASRWRTPARSSS